MRQPSITLYRPVGPHELEAIAASRWRAYPPRLPEQPIFYPVATEGYAREITERWNVPAYGVGYVTRARVRADFLSDYPPQIVGARRHQEYWIPAEDLPAFNAALVGLIVVTGRFPRCIEGPAPPTHLA